MKEGVIIGSGLNAKLFSAKTGYPIFYNTVKRPYPFEFTSKEVLSPIFEESTREIKKKGGTTTLVGPQKMVIWDLLSFVLSLEGKDPLSGKKSLISIEYDDELTLIYSFGNNITKKIKTENIYIFEPEQLYSELPLYNEKEIKDQIIDRFKIYKTNPEFDLWEREKDFVNEVWAFDHPKLGRLHKERPKKKLLSLSYLTEDEKIDPEYTQRFSRYIIEKELEEGNLKNEGRETRERRKFEETGIEIDGIECKFEDVEYELEELSPKIKKRFYWIIDSDEKDRFFTGHIT